MKTIAGIIIVIIISFLQAKSQDNLQSILDNKLTIKASNKTISQLLDLISAEGKVYFSFDSGIIDTEKIVDISVQNQSIKDILDSLLDFYCIYKVIGDQIIIIPNKIENNETGQIPAKQSVILIKGRVIDLNNKEIISYAGILLKGSSLGTLTNQDGEFELKIPYSAINDTITVTCLGYSPNNIPVIKCFENEISVFLKPVSVQLKEIKVTVINPEEIINKIRDKIAYNYSLKDEIMTSFYREVLKQDNKYIDVSEAIMEIKKSNYNNSFSEDKVRFVKGRKSVNVLPFKYVDFKIQGGPYYITKLDVVKTIDSFLDPEYMGYYNYYFEEILAIDNRDTYAIRFKPREKVDYPCYQGILYVDMSTLALVKAEFSLSRSTLRFAHESLIKKKPKDFYVRPINANYFVSYRLIANKWRLSSAQAAIEFRVKSKKDKINSIFKSVSDLLITEIRPDDDSNFRRTEIFNQKDIFSEKIQAYDKNYWEDYNIIKPSVELRKAIENYFHENDSLFNDKINTKTIN